MTKRNLARCRIIEGSRQLHVIGKLNELPKIGEELMFVNDKNNEVGAQEIVVEILTVKSRKYAITNAKRLLIKTEMNSYISDVIS